MKIIFAFIAAFILTLSGSFSLNLSEVDTGHGITTLDCIHCHGHRDLHNMSPNVALIVHQPNNPQFIAGLESFLSAHTEEEAAIKLVDYQRVVDIVTSQ